ncbi:MAG TPA: sigma 54-interacting transcriptional regulator [Candidatus Methylacidiphilales bacterium]
MPPLIAPNQEYQEPSQAWLTPPILKPKKLEPIDMPRNDFSLQPTSLSGLEADFVGNSSALRAVLKQIEIVAPTRASVLILGETGTGKELVARAIHNFSQRRNRSLVKVNCAAIPSGLLESELFGHEKGAFTGAIARKTGRFELANGGTLFLDEIGDFPPDLQPKLLRVLQEKEFERVGGHQPQPTDARIIAATSRSLPQMVVDRQFRSDLYYRLNVFPIRIPPLRERVADIPCLVWHFVKLFADQVGRQIERISPEAMEALKSYPWPGNIRELQNFIERAVILSPGKTLHVALEDLEQLVPARASLDPENESTPATLYELERRHILKALAQTRWLVGGPNGAAVALGLKRTTLLSRMQKLGISRKNPA